MIILQLKWTTKICHIYKYIKCWWRKDLLLCKTKLKTQLLVNTSLSPFPKPNLLQHSQQDTPAFNPVISQKRSVNPLNGQRLSDLPVISEWYQCSDQDPVLRKILVASQAVSCFSSSFHIQFHEKEILCFYLLFCLHCASKYFENFLNLTSPVTLFAFSSNVKEVWQLTP